MEEHEHPRPIRSATFPASRLVLAALVCFVLAILTALSPGWISPALLGAIGIGALAGAAFLGRHAVPSSE